MELVYGCNPCGHNNMGIRAVLSQNSARDPTFVQPTLERGRVDSLKTEAVLETFQNVVQKTKFPLSLGQRKVIVVNLLHGIEFIS